MRMITEVPIETFAHKKVLVRCGLNVPLSKEGKVMDELRVRRMLPTLAYLQAAGAKIVILAHIGREVHETLKPVSDYMQTFFPHTFVPGPCIGPVAYAAVEMLSDGACVMLENVRGDTRESESDATYVHAMAGLGDVYVNDAFPDDHRAHASVTGIPALLPHYCGIALSEEVMHLQQACTPAKHSIAIIGGAKFETKEPLIRKLLKKYEHVYLGGALANDLLKARNFVVGKSVVQGVVADDLVSESRLHHPVDVVVERSGVAVTIPVQKVQPDDVIVDVGPKTVEQIVSSASLAPLVVWNGPLGWYEKGYSKASQDLGDALASVDGTTIIGGGDTIAVLDRERFSSEKTFTFVSAGGGAMLDFLIQGTLPGIAALE